MGPQGPVEAEAGPRLSEQLSALLLELVETPALPLEGWSPELRAGGRVGRFELVRELGRGGFGVVYEALDGDLSRRVALKVVKPGTRLSARGSEWLQREAEAVACLNHPNIVKLYDLGRGPAGPYLVMELLRGETLAERVRRGPLPVADAVRVGRAVSRALVHAHGAGVVHRDLSAANVHLGEDGSVKVLDFGLARLFGRGGTGSGGTPAYMAPEQWRGEEGDAWTDLFALGVILYQALCGELPDDPTEGRPAEQAGPAKALPRRAGPAALRRLIGRMVERNPEMRPSSAGEVLAALEAIDAGHTGARRRMLWAAALLAAALAVGAGWAWSRRPGGGAESRRSTIPAAGEAYAAGISCLAHPNPANGNVTQCDDHFEQTLALDPSFAMAHYQLAATHFLPGASSDAARKRLQPALAAAERLPRRDAQLVRALAARIDGRVAEAGVIYDGLLADRPEDRDALRMASHAAYEAEDWRREVRLAARLVALEPRLDPPLDDLIDALGRAGQERELRALVERLEREEPGRTDAIVFARVWLGEAEAAVRVARRAAAGGGAAEVDALRYALQAAGEYVEMEAVARRALAGVSGPDLGMRRLRVDMALTAQARVKEALRWLDGSWWLYSADDRSSMFFRRAMIAAATGHPGAAWREAVQAHAIDRDHGATLAVVLHLLGDPEHAERLAADLAPGSIPSEECAALRALRASDAEGAKAILRRLERRDPWPGVGLAPSYLLAEVSAATGDDAGTVAAVERFRRLPPDRIWRAWAYPRAGYLAALARDRLGDRDGARREIDRVVALLARADPGVKLAGEARALQRRLARP